MIYSASFLMRSATRENPSATRHCIERDYQRLDAEWPNTFLIHFGMANIASLNRLCLFFFCHGHAAYLGPSMSWLEVAEKDGQPWYRHAVYCIRGRLFIGVLLSLSSSSNYGNAGGNDVMLYMRFYI
jgi:hypothetical protein